MKYFKSGFGSQGLVTLFVHPSLGLKLAPVSFQAGERDMGGTELSLSAEENCRMRVRLYDLKSTPPILFSILFSSFSYSRRGKPWAEVLHWLTGVARTCYPAWPCLPCSPTLQAEPRKKLVAWREF